MKKAVAGRLRRLNPWSLGLLAASLLFLVGGAFLAVSLEGLARVLLAACAFAGYLYFSSRAFRDLFPGLLSEGDPDPERDKAGEARSTREGTPHLTAA